MADFSTIRKEDCRETPIPAGCRLGGSRTVVLQSVLNEIKEHGRSSMHEEVCGVLVGALCWDDGPYLLIDARIEGKHASHQSGSVTFTSETWTYIHEELAAKHANRKIVGWYHTHPGFGIFLSNMDAFIHENFFSFPWQPAYVFDPQSETDGFFFLTDGNLVKEEVSIVPDVKPIVKEPMLAPDAEDRIIIEEAPRHHWQWPLVIAVVLAALFAGAALFEFFLLRTSEKDEQLKKLREEVAEKDNLILQYQQKADEWVVHRKTYEKEIRGLTIKVTEITAERGRMESVTATNRMHIASLEKEKSSLEKEKSRLEKENIQLEKERARLDAEIQNMARKLEQLSKDKDAIEKEWKSALEWDKKLQEKINELQELIAEPRPIPGSHQNPIPPQAPSTLSPPHDAATDAKSHSIWWHLHPF